MPDTTDATTKRTDRLRRWGLIFADADIGLPDETAVNALMEISGVFDAGEIDEEMEAEIRTMLEASPLLHDARAAYEIGETRRLLNTSPRHWWWWPERL